MAPVRCGNSQGSLRIGAGIGLTRHADERRAAKMRVSTPEMRQGRRAGWSKKERHYVYLGLAFASPWIIGFLVFTVYPFFGSLYFSLTDYDLFSPPR